MSSCDRKNKYTLIEAKQALKEIALIDDREKKEQRYYQCWKCQMYHLTSMTIQHQNKIVAKVNSIREHNHNQEAEYWLKRLKIPNNN